MSFSWILSRIMYHLRFTSFSWGLIILCIMTHGTIPHWTYPRSSSGTLLVTPLRLLPLEVPLWIAYFTSVGAFRGPLCERYVSVVDNVSFPTWTTQDPRLLSGHMDPTSLHGSPTLSTNRVSSRSTVFKSEVRFLSLFGNSKSRTLCTLG